MKGKLVQIDHRNSKIQNFKYLSTAGMLVLVLLAKLFLMYWISEQGTSDSFSSRFSTASFYVDHVTAEEQDSSDLDEDENEQNDSCSSSTYVSNFSGADFINTKLCSDHWNNKWSLSDSSIYILVSCFRI
jgi:hypothetical protein